MEDWIESKKRAQTITEDIVKQFNKLTNRNFIEVEDERDYLEHIDFIDNKGSLQVKVDFQMNKYGNFYIQLADDNRENGKWEHCKADLFLYVDGVSGIVYKINIKKIVNNWKEFYKKLSTSTNCKKQTSGRITRGKTIAIKVMLQEGYSVVVKPIAFAGLQSSLA